MNNFNGKIVGNPLVTPIKTYTKQEIDDKLAKDDAMSDTSENAVHNKVIKAYVDAANTALREEIETKASAEYVNNIFSDLAAQIGDTETALDNIIAIQNSYIGGDSV